MQVISTAFFNLVPEYCNICREQAVQMTQFLLHKRQHLSLSLGPLISTKSEKLRTFSNMYSHFVKSKDALVVLILVSLLMLNPFPPVSANWHL